MASTVEALVSSTIAAIQAATDQYNTVKDDASLREAFHGAGGGLLRIKQALEAAKAQIAGRSLIGDSERARNVLEVCNTKAKLAESLFKGVAQAPEASRFKCYRAAVKQEGQGRTVEDLVKEMMNDVCVLAEDDAIKEAMKDQVTGLRDAIEKLSSMDPSVPKEGSGDSYNNWGTGDMLNAPGGKVTKNSFSGTTFPGTVHF